MREKGPMTFTEYRAKMLTMAEDCVENADHHRRGFNWLGIYHAASAILMAPLIPLAHPLFALPLLFLAYRAIVMQTFGREAYEDFHDIRQDILDDLHKTEAESEEYQDDEH